MMIKYSHLFLYCCLLFFTQCQTPDTSHPKIESDNNSKQTSEDRIDYHSAARPQEAVTKHLSLDLEADFDKKILHGFARYTIENHQAKQIFFDTRDLIIEKVTLGEKETPTTFQLAEAREYLGQALSIDLMPDTKLLTIYYATQAQAAALDWTQPSKTAGKKHPFLFTQGQAVLTRSWIPCQDSPGIRITYDARIQVPKDLLAVMSASNPQQKNTEGIYTFKMEQAIPSYLIALAVGDLEFGAIGSRTGIYAEPVMLKAALYEFSETEKMLEAAEKLYGPYLWERYDVIVLPPSFPFGGMENPRLTFATPTVIAGDRSLTSLIAHELAHSWSGNLVTNATWNDFWLNEGFTVYFERRIMEALYGIDYEQMLAVLGQQDWEKAVTDLDAVDTHLLLDLKGRDPDDGMTDIAYEKGAAFLTLLEEKTGREKFDVFLKKYFTEHRFATITTAEFISYLKKNLLEPNAVEINIDEWIFQSGVPANNPQVTSRRFEMVEAQLARFEKGGAANNLTTKDWTTHEWLHFIRHLPRDLATDRMQQLDRPFQFSQSGNAEILAAWFELAIGNGYSKIILPQIEAFLEKVGRRKFLEPLYGAFKDSGQLEEGRKIYAKARKNYHPVSIQTIDELLEVKE